MTVEQTQTRKKLKDAATLQLGRIPRHSRRQKNMYRNPPIHPRPTKSDNIPVPKHSVPGRTSLAPSPEYHQSGLIASLHHRVRDGVRGSSAQGLLPPNPGILFCTGRFPPSPCVRPHPSMRSSVLTSHLVSKHEAIHGAKWPTSTIKTSSSPTAVFSSLANSPPRS